MLPQSRGKSGLKTTFFVCVSQRKFVKLEAKEILNFLTQKLQEVVIKIKTFEIVSNANTAILLVKSILQMLCRNDVVRCDLASCYLLCRYICLVFLLISPCFMELLLKYIWSKFYFDRHVFLLKFMHVECIWVNVRVREVVKTVKLPLTSVKPILD